MRARAWPGADQDIHVEIFERRIQDLFHVGKQPVNFVDEENLARRMVVSTPVRSSFFCITGPEVCSKDSQFLRDDGGEGGFAQAGRAVEQHVVHGFAAFVWRLQWRCEFLLELGLAGEIGQPRGPESGFELALAF